jgi:hypothetical protein
LEGAQGGSAPLEPAALTPRDISGQMKGGAVLALLCLAGLWGLAQGLPRAPVAAVALAWTGLAAMLALPLAWSRAVSEGHRARLLNPHGILHRVFFRGGLRVALAAVAGAVGAAVILVRLSDAPATIWVTVAGALVLPLMLMAPLRDRLRGEWRGLHAERTAIRAATWVSVATLLCLHAALMWIYPRMPAPLELPSGGSALLAEAMAMARAWSMMEAWALGQAGQFGEWGRAGALAMASALQAGFLASVVTLGIALGFAATAHGRAEMARALAPASAHPGPIPAPGLAGLGAAVICAAVLAWATLTAERQIVQVPPPARPSAQVLIGAERIAGALYATGTMAALAELRTDTFGEDAAARARLSAALDGAFDRVEANVELFLDEYYSLSAEYLRLFHWATGGLDAHLERRLEDSLAQGAPFAEVDDLGLSELGAEAARAQALIAAQTALLAEAALSETEAGGALVLAEYAAMPPLPDVAGLPLAQARQRWLAAAGTGLVAQAVARGVVARLAARGITGMAARMLLRSAGLLAAFGMDYALVRLDEHMNRDAFREEILREVRAARTQAQDALQR